MGNPITFNAKENRYEQEHGGYVVYANTHTKDGVLYIDYVYAPPELRGQGAAGCLMEALMDHVRKENLKAKPVCGFAAGWLRKHSEYVDLIPDQ